MSSDTKDGRTDMLFTLQNTFLNKNHYFSYRALESKGLQREVMDQKRGVRIPKEYVPKEKPLTGF